MTSTHGSRCNCTPCEREFSQVLMTRNATPIIRRRQPKNVQQRRGGEGGRVAATSPGPEGPPSVLDSPSPNQTMADDPEGRSVYMNPFGPPTSETLAGPTGNVDEEFESEEENGNGRDEDSIDSDSEPLIRRWKVREEARKEAMDATKYPEDGDSITVSTSTQAQAQQLHGSPMRSQTSGPAPVYQTQGFTPVNGHSGWRAQTSARTTDGGGDVGSGHQTFSPTEQGEEFRTRQTGFDPDEQQAAATNALINLSREAYDTEKGVLGEGVGMAGPSRAQDGGPRQSSINLGHGALPDYQMQLHLLEVQNKKRLEKARAEVYDPSDPQHTPSLGDGIHPQVYHHHQALARDQMVREAATAPPLRVNRPMPKRPVTTVTRRRRQTKAPVLSQAAIALANAPSMNSPALQPQNSGSGPGPRSNPMGPVARPSPMGPQQQHPLSALPSHRTAPQASGINTGVNVNPNRGFPLQVNPNFNLNPNNQQAAPRPAPQPLPNQARPMPPPPPSPMAQPGVKIVAQPGMSATLQTTPVTDVTALMDVHWDHPRGGHVHFEVSRPRRAAYRENGQQQRLLDLLLSVTIRDGQLVVKCGGTDIVVDLEPNMIDRGIARPPNQQGPPPQMQPPQVRAQQVGGPPTSVPGSNQQIRLPQQSFRPPQQSFHPPQQAFRPPQQAFRPPPQSLPPQLALSSADEQQQYYAWSRNRRQILVNQAVARLNLENTRRGNHGIGLTIEEIAAEMDRVGDSEM